VISSFFNQFLARADDLDKKICEYYPDGVFTKESYEAVKDYFDEKESEAIWEYWKAHPEVF